MASQLLLGPSWLRDFTILSITGKGVYLPAYTQRFCGPQNTNPPCPGSCRTSIRRIDVTCLAVWEPCSAGEKVCACGIEELHGGVCISSRLRTQVVASPGGHAHHCGVHQSLSVKSGVMAETTDLGSAACLARSCLLCMYVHRWLLNPDVCPGRVVDRLATCITQYTQCVVAPSQVQAQTSMLCNGSSARCC
jgi:hypothetical protein